LTINKFSSLFRPVTSDILYACTGTYKTTINGLFCVYEISLKMVNPAETCWKEQ